MKKLEFSLTFEKNGAYILSEHIKVHKGPYFDIFTKNIYKHIFAILNFR